MWKNLVWKYQGNKIQFDFNNEVDEIAKQVLWAVQHAKVDYSKELLDELCEKLRKRNKLIRIADSSAGGWDTVRLYEANPIASDSDDESKIYKAENRALRESVLVPGARHLLWALGLLVPVLFLQQGHGDHPVFLSGQQHSQHIQVCSLFVAPTVPLHSSQRLDLGPVHASSVESTTMSEDNVHISTEQQERPGTSQPIKQTGNLKDEYGFDSFRFTHDFYEYEQGQKHLLVKGRLRKNIQFWRDIGASEFVLDVIEHGYKIPFYSMPQQSFSHNNRSALSEYEFVSEAFKGFLIGL